MNNQAFEDLVKRLEKVNEVITKLDPAIRAEVFVLFRGFITARQPNSDSDAESVAGATSASDFFSKYETDDAAENATMVAAFIFSQYGAGPFSTDEVRKLASDHDVTIPDRIDKTFSGKTAFRGGKPLFREVGRGKFKPTVEGRSHFEATYKVTKGRKRRSANA